MILRCKVRISTGVQRFSPCDHDNYKEDHTHKEHQHVEPPPVTIHDVMVCYV